MSDHPHKPDPLPTQRADTGAQDAAAPPTPTIEGYELIQPIGRGGMGVVYEGYQRSTGRRVAVKFMHDFGRDAESSRRRFEREVELAARLTHPNIVSLLDSGVHSGRYYYVMEHVEGLPLDQFVRATGDIGVDRSAALPADDSRALRSRSRHAEALRVFCLIADAVDFAHQRGVLHRDLKPSNVLVDARGQPHLLDFGLAKAIDPQSGAFRDVTLSEPGQLIGTLAYMSPEQARGDVRQISVRSDVYSLGAMLYELLTGRLPTSLDGPLSDVLQRIAEVDPPSIARGPARLSADLNAIVMRALAKEPTRRYATAGDLAADVRRYLDDQPVLARPEGGGARLMRWVRRHRAIAGVGGSLTLLLLIVGIASGVKIAIEQRQKIANLDLAREKLRFAMEELDYAVFETNRNLENVLGTAETRRALIDKAIEFYDKLPHDAALLGLEDLAGPQYGKLGDALLRRGDVERAERYNALSLKAARAITRRQPDSTEARRALAVAAKDAAKTARDLAQSEPLLSESVALFRELGDRRGLAEALTQLAERMLFSGEIARATPVAAEVVELARALTTDRPEDGRLHDEVLILCGRVVQTAHFANADTLFHATRDATADLARASAERLPDDLQVQYQAIFTLNLCAEHTLTRGDVNYAASTFAEARDAGDTLRGKHPEFFKLRLVGASSYGGLARVAVARGDQEGALALFDRAADIVRTAYELQPNEVVYRRVYTATLSAMGATQLDAGKLDEACTTYERYLDATGPLFEEVIDFGGLRAYAWLTLAQANEERDPPRAAVQRQRGLDDLRRVEARRPLKPPEQSLLESLRSLNVGDGS